MQIWHRVGYSHRDNVDSALDAIGVRYKKTPGLHGAYLITFEITEADPKWPRVSELLHQKPGFNFVWTEYTVEETLSAEWLAVAAIRHMRFANEARGWRYVSLEKGCPACGVGVRQKAPFRVMSEPRLKTTFATTINCWPLLAVPQMVRALLDAGIRGFESWPVLLLKTGQPCIGFQELHITTVAGPALVEEEAETERFRREACAACGQVRYTSYNRGMMPLRRSQLATDVDLQLTYEWFGTLHAAHRQILVSQRVARIVMDSSATGIVLWPIRLV